jgi:hypothetical protein
LLSSFGLLLGGLVLAACQWLPSRLIALACDGPAGASGVPGYVEIDLERRSVFDGLTTYVDGAGDAVGAQIDVHIDPHSIAWQSATEYRVLWRSVLYRDSGTLFLQLPGGRDRQAICRPTDVRKRVL